MAYYLITRRSRHFSTTAAAAAAAVEQYRRVIDRNFGDPNLERMLSSAAAILSPAVVATILRLSSPTAALRFFVWSAAPEGGQLRHSAAAFAAASNIFPPESLHDLLNFYKLHSRPLSVHTFKTLISLCRSPDNAIRILRRMPDFECRPNISCYNAVLRLIDAGDAAGDAALALLDEMLADGLLPDVTTYINIIRALSGRIQKAREIVRQMRSHGCVPNVVVYTALLEGACAAGDVEASEEILEEMEGEENENCAPNVVTYTCLMKCLCEKNRLNDALEVLDRMRQRGCYANRATITTLLRGFLTEGQLDGAYNLIERVIHDENVSSESCYSVLVVCFLRSGKRDLAEMLISRMLSVGVLPDGLASNSFLRDLCVNSLFIDGYRWFEEMAGRELGGFDSDASSSLLAGLCKEGHVKEAITLARTMIDQGIRVEDEYIDSVARVLDSSGEGSLLVELLSIGKKE